MGKETVTIRIYPTISPPASRVVYQLDPVAELCETSVRLMTDYWPLRTCDREEIQTYVTQLSDINIVTHHVELVVFQCRLDPQLVLAKLGQLLPQFVWVRGSETSTGSHQTYYFDFIPLAFYDRESFPFDIDFAESVTQQLSCRYEEAMTSLCASIDQLLMNELVLEAEPSHQPPKKKRRFAKKKAKKTVKQLEDVSSSELIYYKEKSKVDTYAKERMKLANEKLEVLVENIERSLMDQGLAHLEQVDREDDADDWNKQECISLREYTYLMQKAIYLEQVWLMNSQLVQQTEKMTIQPDRVVYQKDQVRRVKHQIATTDVYVVLNDSHSIESRVSIRKRPLFRKPYVKLMRMDYHSLLSKAAYFDLLQGENYFLAKEVQTRRETYP